MLRTELVEARAQFLVRRHFREDQVIYQSVNIKSGATDNEWNFIPTRDVENRSLAEFFEVGDRKHLLWIGHIKQMMFCKPLFFFTDLAGADIHASIDLPGVGRYYLAIEFF